MRRFYTLRLRTRNLFRRNRVEQELDDEMQHHLEQQIEQNIVNGLTPDEARYAALRTFGNITGTKERLREIAGWTSVQVLANDVRYALRQFQRAPAFVVVAVVSLALGIGANTAIFTAIDALMLKPLPVSDPASLVSFRSWLNLGGFPGFWQFGVPSFTTFEELRQRTDAFSDMAAIYRESAFIEGAEARIAIVTAAYFTTLGINAAVGRTFTPDEDVGRGNHPVAIISDAYWRRRYGFAPDTVGRTFTLKGTTYTIVGILPRGFSGDRVGLRQDVWFPMTMIGQVMSDRAALAQNPNMVQVGVVARLKSGVTVEQAESQLQTVYRELDDAAPGTPPLIRIESHASGYSPRREYFARPLAILAIVIGIVLLIACANVANLLLARSAARQKETSIRLALGAGRFRILQQHLTESMLLATLAGVLGVLLASIATQVLANVVNVGPLAVEVDLTPDRRVLAFAAGVSVLTAVLFGTLPAWRASRMSLLKVSGVTASTGGTRRGRFGLRQLLVVAQVALSVFLLIGAGLFVRTFRNLKFQDLGYDRENVLLVTADRLTSLNGKAVAEIYRTIRPEIESIPGVTSVGTAAMGLLSASGATLNSVTIPGYVRKPGESTAAGWNVVAPGYFKTLGMRLSAGRDFTDADDAGRPRVAIINETMARRYFGRPDPIGSRFGVRRDTGNEIEIIGVVQDAKYAQVKEAKQDTIYFPYLQEVDRLRAVNLVVRTNGDIPGLPGRLREILGGTVDDFPVVSIEWMDDQLNRALMIERLVANLSSLFGVLAALLACVGLYGTISFTIARRTGEIGMRLALGAQPSDVLAMVITQSMILVLAGILIGVPAGFAAATLVSNQLFGVSATDPLTAAVATVFMITSSGVAALIPARRAAATDPTVALRYE